EPAPVGGHEVDRLGRGELGRHDEVALVLPLLGVEDDHHVAGADLLDRLGDGGELDGAARHARSSRGGAYGATSDSTYFASTSTSRLTARSRAPGPRVVTSMVWGISATVNASGSRSATVRLTPSTAMLPFSTM